MTKISSISLRRKAASAVAGPEYATKLREIVASAAKLFNEKGYNYTTLADIGTSVGLDRATLYYYIGSKEELLRKLIEGVLDSNIAEAERIAEQKKIKPREKIRNIVELLMKSYDDNYPQMYVYIREQMHQVATAPGSWAKDIQQKTRRFEAITLEIIQQGIKDGEFRDDIGVRLLANSLFGMLNWTHRWYHPGGELSAHTIAEGFCQIFFDGIQSNGNRAGGESPQE